MMPAKELNGMKRFLESQRGFTLIELITVMAIIGIVMAIAAPNFSKWKEKYQINGQARKVYLDLMLARTNAIKNNNDTRVTFNTTNHAYKVHDDKNSNGTEDSGEALKSVNLENSVKFAYNAGISDIDGNTVTATISFNGSLTVIFDARGQANASGSVFLLHENDIGVSNSRARSISVLQSTGAVDYWSYDGTVSPPWS